ncbi:HET-domain-containing protein [Pseudovirgaria hyperparasitica]|uniref:HET-domain-containing protein n=1 Tax=Pseudovirgaria hyperparasitica TaxID=470096 RepID=A0A6A6W017_9PEZI|nr:HET-domain-containing protein [Pseudovirgaria hyperparasitica]KAF2756242.1 HET-domain-containing protein [Pseudovirgaria hyperparasitica]
MWLINTDTLQLETFLDDRIPAYAILSHTWEDGELTFKDMQNPDPLHKASFLGFGKVHRTCEIARDHGIGYAWVDTCCIDKTSSSELAEAINSMFKWYERAEICYAYLSDVSVKEGDPLPRSRWFMRGWTLQELLAPRRLVFYNKDWASLGTLKHHDELADDESDDDELIGEVPSESAESEIDEPRNDKIDGTRLKDDNSDENESGGNQRVEHQPDDNLVNNKLVDQVSHLAGIDEEFITSEWKVSDASIAKRMSWASTRKTTRIEDTAYCLLGIFDVNMPLLYGEGEKAFQRLQEEIMKTSNDFTIFAWGIVVPRTSVPSFHGMSRPNFGEHNGLLASIPEFFQGCQELITDELGEKSEPYVQTKQVLHLALPRAVGLSKHRASGDSSRVVLPCRASSNYLSLLAIGIWSPRPGIFQRSSEYLYLTTRDEIASEYTQQKFHVSLAHYNISSGPSFLVRSSEYILFRRLPPNSSITYVDPGVYWNKQNRIIGRNSKLSEDTEPLTKITISHQDGDTLDITLRGFSWAKIVAVRQQKHFNIQNVSGSDVLAHEWSAGRREVHFANMRISVYPPRKISDGPEAGIPVVPIDVVSTQHEVHRVGDRDDAEEVEVEEWDQLLRTRQRKT